MHDARSGHSARTAVLASAVDPTRSASAPFLLFDPGRGQVLSLEPPSTPLFSTTYTMLTPASRQSTAL